MSGKGTDDITTKDDYIIDEAFLDKYAQVVNWALESDLYVIQYNKSDYLFTNVSIVNVPSVNKVEVAKGKKKEVTVKNLDKKATVTYKVVDKKIATVSKDGVVKGLKKGKTTVIVTVAQFGRKDLFKSTVVVK